MPDYQSMKDSGVEWIGKIPERWGIASLFQLGAEVKKKNGDLQEQNLLSLSYGKIKRKDIKASEGLVPATFDGYNVIEAGDIVLRLTDLQNDHTSLRVGRATERGIITSAYTTIRPIDLDMSSYLYYVLHSFDIRKGFYGMGSGVRQGLVFGEAKTLRLPVPPDDERAIIVDYLDSACANLDAAIAEAKASIEEYKLLKQSVITQAVTKGLDPNVPMKDSGVEWIGEVPAHWGLSCIKHVAHQITLRAEGNEGYIGLENIESQSGRRIESKNHDFVADGTSLQVRTGNVIFGKLRPYLAKCYLAEADGCCSTEFVVLEPKTISAAFLRDVMLSGTFVDWINMSTYGTKMPRANWAFIGSTVIPVPTPAEQESVVARLDLVRERVDCLVSEKQATISDLESYKKSLIYEVVTGKRRVA